MTSTSDRLRLPVLGRVSLLFDAGVWGFDV